MENAPMKPGNVAAVDDAAKLMLVQQELTRCVLENRGLEALVQIVARLAGAQVIVQDIKGLILAKAGEMTGADTMQQISDISYDGQKIGKFYFITDTVDSHANRLIMDFAVSLVSLEIFKQKHFADSAAKRRLDFIHDLLLGENIRDEDIINRGRYLGIGLDQVMGLIIIDIDGFIKFAIARDEESLSKTKEQIYLATTYAVDLKSIIVPRSDKLIVLIPLNDNDLDNEQNCLTIAHNIRKQIAARVSGVTTTIGIGSVCRNLFDLRTSYLEATEAINIGRIALGKDRVINFKDLGVFLLLPKLMRDSPKLNTLLAFWLGKIVDYDRAKGTELLKTLETYFDTDCDINETSARLHIHRNTLRYRLDKVEELTEGRGLMAENKLHYLLLIKIWRLSK